MMTNLIKIMYYMFILVLAQEFPPNLSILKVYQTPLFAYIFTTQILALNLV